MSACAVDLSVADATRIVCTTDTECPAPYTCQVSAQRCVAAGHEDHDPPVILGATSSDLTHVVLQLDEDADPTSMSSVVITIVPTLAVLGVTIDSSLRNVTVETDTQTPGQDYTMSISGIADLFSNAIAGDIEVFTGFGAFPDRAHRR